MLYKGQSNRNIEMVIATSLGKQLLFHHLVMDSGWALNWDNAADSYRLQKNPFDAIVARNDYLLSRS
jgi:hypothetical protein